MYTIDIRNINTKKELHEILREVLPLPDYYGNNLDALYDVLTETSDEMEIEFIWDDNRTDLSEEVEKTIKGLRRLSEDIMDECPNISIEWLEDIDEESPTSNRVNLYDSGTNHDFNKDEVYGDDPDENVGEDW